jgi:maltose/moltooligosaccharide transporter
MPSTDESIAETDTTDFLSETWHVGSLTYTRSRLINVFSWMLWGDLCLVISEQVVLRMVPLQMLSLGATNAAIGIVTGSIFSAMNWIMNPLISTGSDRYRSRLGRRMPFMLYTAIPIALFLMAIGYSGEISRWMTIHLPVMARMVAHLSGRWLPGVNLLPQGARLTIAMLAMMMVLFRFFDLFPQCVYYYLFTDVIPQTVMGTFICLFGVASAVGTLIFNFFLLPHADADPHLIYGVSAGLYLFTFLLLPLMVREGEYPPPPPSHKGRPIATIIGWAREVFSHQFYWEYFLVNSAYRWAYTPFNLFLIIYAKKLLGYGSSEFGHLMTIVLIAQMPSLFFLGPILDRYHPTRVAVAGFVLMAISAVAGFFFIHNKSTFIGCTMGVFVAVAVTKGAMSTLGPRVLPRARYGQFCAANSMVSETGMLFLSYACGAVLDRLGQPFLFVWLVAFGIFGLIISLSLYRSWMAHGGDLAYEPPAVTPAVVGFPVVIRVSDPETTPEDPQP